MDKEISSHLSMETILDPEDKEVLVDTMENMAIGSVIDKFKSEVIDHKKEAGKYSLSDIEIDTSVKDKELETGILFKKNKPAVEIESDATATVHKED